MAVQRLWVIRVSIAAAVAISWPRGGSGCGEWAERTGADIRLKKGTHYELRFVESKFAGAPATEHPVVIQVCHVGSFGFFRFTQEIWRPLKIRISIVTVTADVSIRSSAGCGYHRRRRTRGCVNASSRSTDGINFQWGQFASALATEHSVVIQVCHLSSFCGVYKSEYEGLCEVQIGIVPAAISIGSGVTGGAVDRAHQRIRLGGGCAHEFSFHRSQ